MLLSNMPGSAGLSAWFMPVPFLIYGALYRGTNNHLWLLLTLLAGAIFTLMKAGSAMAGGRLWGVCQRSLPDHRTDDKTSGSAENLSRSGWCWIKSLRLKPTAVLKAIVELRGESIPPAFLRRFWDSAATRGWISRLLDKRSVSTREFSVLAVWFAWLCKEKHLHQFLLVSFFTACSWNIGR